MDIEKEIIELLRDTVENKKIIDGIDYDTELIKSEIIESLIIIQMISELEAKYSIEEIDFDDIIPENFSSVRSIANLVRKYVNG